MSLLEVIFKRLMKKVPSRSQNQKYLPSEIKKDFENMRMILDCTEVFAARPTLISRQSQLFSSYKHCVSLKGLVGISPHGVVKLRSKTLPWQDIGQGNYCALWSAWNFCRRRRHSGKGFLIQSQLPPGVTLNILPFPATLPPVHSRWDWRHHRHCEMSDQCWKSHS